MILEVIRNFFRPKQTKEEKRTEAELAFRHQERAFQRYAKDLDGSIKKFELMAVKAMENNQRQNALLAARFANRMSAIKERVLSVSQHFEMLHTLNITSDVMVEFMDTCKKLGCDFSQQIDIGQLTSSQASMEAGLSNLNFITECTEQAFAQIEESLTLGDANISASSPEDEKALDELLKRYGEAGGAGSKAAVSAGGEQTAAGKESEEELLRRLAGV